MAPTCCIHSSPWGRCFWKVLCVQLLCGAPNKLDPSSVRRTDSQNLHLKLLPTTKTIRHRQQEEQILWKLWLESLHPILWKEKNKGTVHADQILDPSPELKKKNMLLQNLNQFGLTCCDSRDELRHYWKTLPLALKNSCVIVTCNEWFPLQLVARLKQVLNSKTRYFPRCKQSWSVHPSILRSNINYFVS